MEDEILLIKSVQEQTSKKSGETFWKVSTDKGEYTMFEVEVFNDVAKNQGNVCKLKTVRDEKYSNIKGFVEVVEVREKEPVKEEGRAEEKAETKGWAKIEMLVSYAKDLVVAGKEANMETAIKAVIGAYNKASGEL